MIIFNLNEWMYLIGFNSLLTLAWFNSYKSMTLSWIDILLLNVA